MTYEEIIKLWSDSKSQWRNYEFAVGGIGGQIYSFLREELNVKGEKSRRVIKMIPPNEKDDDKLRNTEYAPFACVEFKDDGWAEVGIILLLEYDENSWPKQQYRFVFKIKRTSENWLVQAAKDGPELKLSFEPTRDELALVGEEFDKLIRFQTIESLDNWLGIQK
jgi:hypothetical protein